MNVKRVKQGRIMNYGQGRGLIEALCCLWHFHPRRGVSINMMTGDDLIGVSSCCCDRMVWKPAERSLDPCRGAKFNVVCWWQTFGFHLLEAQVEFPRSVLARFHRRRQTLLHHLITKNGRKIYRFFSVFIIDDFDLDMANRLYFWTIQFIKN